MCENEEEKRNEYQHLYKYNGKTAQSTQQERRELLLKQQKELRAASVDEKRHILEILNDVCMEETASLPRKVYNHEYRYKLMRAEWLTELPDDLDEKWLIKLCPEGVRYFIVATKGFTTCYALNGRVLTKFKSKLPGGNRKDGLSHRFTILDGIHHRASNTIFIFDVIAWNSISVRHSEAQFRFYWLKSKFDEDPEMLEINPHFKFVLMDFFVQKSLLQEILCNEFKVNNEIIPLEGVLFYHREGHYVFNKSPLVGWLRTFMLPEILNIDVPEFHLKGKPQNYESIQTYLDGKKRVKKTTKVLEVEMRELEENDDAVEEM